LHRFDTAHECDGRTDRQTDGRTPRRWQRRAKHTAFARKKLKIVYSSLWETSCSAMG